MSQKCQKQSWAASASAEINDNVVHRLLVIMSEDTTHAGANHWEAGAVTDG